MNMSYCRFENTSNAMRNCINALEEDDVDIQEMSEHELRGFDNFLAYAKEIIELEGQILDLKSK